MGTVTVFAPNPLLNITIEGRGGGDEIHVHAGGQGVWVARTAGELGADPVLCGFLGGEPGELLRPLLEALPGERRLVETAAPSGCSVVDRRGGGRELLAGAWSEPPSRHELDDLVSATSAAAGMSAGASPSSCGPSTPNRTAPRSRPRSGSIRHTSKRSTAWASRSKPLETMLER